MKTKVVKAWSLVLVLSLLVTIFAACSKDNNTASPSPSAAKAADASPLKEASAEPSPTGIDTSQKVELQFYMLGGEPKDLAKIEAEVNKLALEELNATVKFNFTTWTDWPQKYRLLLTSGQPVDLIFTAEWTQYQQYAKQGAFLALDELLPKAAPKLYDFVPQEMWDAVRVDGKIQTVPATWKEYVTTGIVYREDLRKKYNLPKPESVETYEQYMEGIAANEPNMEPMVTGVSGEIIAHDYAYREMTNDYVVSNGALSYGLEIMYNTPSEVTSYYGSPKMLEDIKKYKSWAEKGFWSKNVLTRQDAAVDLIIAGKAASIPADNPTRYNDTLIKVQASHPDWELGYYAFPFKRGYAIPVHPIHNGFAVPISSKNPERALAFYEKMVTDKRYNWLTEYGIEGVNFEVEDGKYYKMMGTVETNGFPRESMQGWAWRNPEFQLFDKSFDNVLNMFAEFDKIAKPDKFLGFAEDITPYQAEKAALTQVEKQYLHPLLVGLIPDVEKGLATFMEKAKQAGLEKIQAEYTKQWLAYVQENNIK
jgi:putative aldouronate transport system substrate-binding protein